MSHIGEMKQLIIHCLSEYYMYVRSKIEKLIALD